jgi:hypothetical protein
VPIDYLGLRGQAKEAARKAEIEMKVIADLRERANALFTSGALTLEEIKEKVDAAAVMDPRLRCAKPTNEPIDKARPLPAVPEAYTLLASDGSQINPNPHEPIHYFLINLGAIEFYGGVGDAPEVHTESHLHYAEYTTSGSFTDDQVSLQRDKGERTLLAKLAKKIKQKPVLTLTDGPLELWGEKLAGVGGAQTFSEDLQEYLAALDELHEVGAATAGYVDKPRADLLVRMLEVLAAPGVHTRLFRGVTDAMLLKDKLAYGERSAVFATQSQSASQYTEHRALHFFYLNVGRTETPWLARVEIPAWVASNGKLLDALHAVLVQQSTILGSNAYPYVLHRAHEIALVKFEEHEQVSRLLINELKGLGVQPGELSQKAASKRMRGRRRHAI